MVWIVRRLLLPLVGATVASFVFFNIVVIWFEHGEGLRLNEYAIFFLLCLLFQAVGFCLLVPGALLLSKFKFPGAIYAMVLAVLGGWVGTMIMLPITMDDPPPGFFEPPIAGCGVLSALVWLAFNWDVTKRGG